MSEGGEDTADTSGGCIRFLLSSEAFEYDMMLRRIIFLKIFIN